MMIMMIVVMVIIIIMIMITMMTNINYIVSGTFLTDYTNKSNLHIAVTDSRGEVVEFDQHGLHRQRMGNKSAPEIHIFAEIFCEGVATNLKFCTVTF